MQSQNGKPTAVASGGLPKTCLFPGGIGHTEGSRDHHRRQAPRKPAYGLPWQCGPHTLATAATRLARRYGLTAAMARAFAEAVAKARDLGLIGGEP